MIFWRNYERRGGVMKTEISKQDAIKYLERKSFPGWNACSDKPTVSLSDVEYLIDLIYSQEAENDTEA